MWEGKISRNACGRNVGYKMVAFLSSVVYYFGDLLKSANMAFARHQKFISPWFDFSCHYRTFYNKDCNRRGDFKVTCRVLVNVQVPVCNNFGFLPDRGWRETLPPHLKRNISSPTKFIKCAMFPENKTGKCCFHHPPSRNSTQKYHL